MNPQGSTFSLIGSVFLSMGCPVDALLFPELLAIHLGPGILPLSDLLPIDHSPNPILFPEFFPVGISPSLFLHSKLLWIGSS